MIFYSFIILTVLFPIFRKYNPLAKCEISITGTDAINRVCTTTRPTTSIICISPLKHRNSQFVIVNGLDWEKSVTTTPLLKDFWYLIPSYNYLTLPLIP